MPKRTDIHKIMVIGSGPIIIGQAAEFDYSGTQACLALREEGYEVVLVNSNPATIMTDTTIADKVYIEPLTVESISRIITIRCHSACSAAGGKLTSRAPARAGRAARLACRNSVSPAPKTGYQDPGAAWAHVRLASTARRKSSTGA